MSNASPEAPLSVETDLRLTIDGVPADVESTGERLFVSFRSIPDAVRARSGLPDDGLGPLAALLRTTDLTVEIRVHGRTVAVVGSTAQPGPVSRQLGIAPAELRLGGVAGAFVRELVVQVAPLVRALR